MKESRRLCCFRKDELSLESSSSFESWASYQKALKETGQRLRDRITARSLAHAELNEVRARSGPEVVLFGIGSVIGAGVFVLTVLQALELGDFVAFIAAGNILLDYIIGYAAVARPWTSYFATLLNHHPNDLRIHVPSPTSDYCHLDPLAVSVIASIGIITILSTKAISRLNNLASLVHILIILFIIVAGALEGMTTALLVSAVGQARSRTHIARTHMVPQWLARVNSKTGTPVNATAVMLVVTAIVAFFTSLDILSSLLSISTLFIFMLVAAALLVRYNYVSGETTKDDRNRLIAFLALILGSSIANAAYWATNENGWAGYLATVSVWFVPTIGLWVFVKE